MTRNVTLFYFMTLARKKKKWSFENCRLRDDLHVTFFSTAKIITRKRKKQNTKSSFAEMETNQAALLKRFAFDEVSRTLKTVEELERRFLFPSAASTKTR